MVRTVIWFAYFWYRLIITYPALLKAKKLYKNGQTKEMEQLISIQQKNGHIALLN
ncbi:hypothetical protein [Anaerobacillus sp. CMMVII]|uniref:hypothetical protein n=1 Tax=Anaerobacillus sp. CMMVII TaxID=2755588 RepID=UPI0021B72622|nr:hypothetical protein [Anaerobacillus sp. CMMVII]